MEEFYRNWYEKHIEKKVEAAQCHQKGDRIEDPRNDDAHCFNSKSQQDNIQASQAAERCQDPRHAPEDQISFVGDPTKVIYQNSDLTLYLEKEHHVKQTSFKVDSYSYNLKIEPKKQKPLEVDDIPDFLHEGLLYILDKIKQLYSPNSHNTAYVTLHQEDQISLNSGIN